MSDEEKEMHPKINWPNESGDYKFVQFQNGRENYLRFGIRLEDSEDDYHYRIVERFAKEIGQGLKSEYSSRGRLAYFLEDSDYKIVGAGLSIIAIDNKMAKFGKRSYGYNIGINKPFIEEIFKDFPEWKLKFIH